MNHSPEEPSPAAVRKRRQRRSGLTAARRKALDYAAKLSKTADEAPDSATRKDLYKVIHRIRMRHSHNIKTARPKVMQIIQTFDAVTAREISDDSGLPLEVVLATLETLIKHSKVKAFTRGGREIAGRKGPIRFYKAVTPSQK